MASPPLPPIAPFLARWSASGGAERANKDTFLVELCDLLGVPRPDPTTGDAARDGYVFEKDVATPREGGAPSTGRIDLYKKGCFLLEAKQGSEAGSKKLGTARRGTAGWAVAMQDAHGQALGYAQLLDEPPPFLLVVDIGHCIDLFAAFDGTTHYRPFPDAVRHRLFLSDLERHRDLLRTIFTEPARLDPSKNAARVTREIASHLADLARQLEAEGHPGERIAKFLMRCLFTMFAEDVGLLPAGIFTDALAKRWIPDPTSFPGEIAQLWTLMNGGGNLFGVGTIRRFNGGLFEDPTVLPLSRPSLERLLEAARASWTDVEPAIFGTLLERALDPKERHALGAHYTPRAYVERLVRPTIEEPLRADWDLVRAEVRAQVEAGKDEAARAAVRGFHRKLCATRVLDPACGTGNFLYVTLDLFQRLEGEVLGLLADLGDAQAPMAFEGLTVTPAQFHGIEIKPWAKEIAQLVLWIGWLQHQLRTRGSAAAVPEPILQETGSIECRDAVLAWDRIEPVLGDDGTPVTRWDGETMKASPVTGEPIPDETARTAVVRYVNPRKAQWPEAEFVVGNPPYIGNKRMRLALGDGYVEALRSAHDDVPETADLVMYWWNAAAERVRAGKLRRFGLITTNSITQTFNRKIVQRHLDGEPPMHIAFAIPDHPWVDSADGAAVRVAMTVGAGGRGAGEVLRVTREALCDTGESDLALSRDVGPISSALSSGVDFTAAVALRANAGLSFMGVILVGQGFVVEPSDRLSVEEPGSLRRYLVGNELNQKRKNRLVVDFFGLDEASARSRFPRAYQRLAELVLPERRANPDAGFRERWWIHGRPRPELRAATNGLERFLGICRTAKHLVFQFIEADIIVESKIVAIAVDGAFPFAVLSSRLHLCWAATAGSRHGVGNDFTYNNSLCFDPFPFPAATPAQQARIRELGEALDGHRKRQQAQFPELTITGMYNVLEKLRSGEPLTAKEKTIHEQGLVSVLRQIHDDLDAAVFDAYGWPATLSDEEILERLVALNAERAEEEKRGLIRWLRPEFQNPGGKAPAVQDELPDGGDDDEPATPKRGKRADRAAKATAKPRAAKKPRWPKSLPERLALLRAHFDADPAPLTTAEVAARFAAAKEKDVEPVLESLAALGLLREEGTAKKRQWSGARG